MSDNKKLKPCPFCGGEAEIHRRRTACRFYAQSKREIPQNGKLVRTIEYTDGRKSYEYIKNEFGVWCKDTSCIGRVQKVFPTEAEAIQAWERRSDDEDCGKEANRSSR